MDKDQIIELITRRRRQILVHSIIYYRFNSNIVSDSQYDKWSRELSELHNQYPELSRQADLYNEFKQWHESDGGSGFMLPLDDPYYILIAENLLSYQIRNSNKI